MHHSTATKICLRFLGPSWGVGVGGGYAVLKPIVVNMANSIQATLACAAAAAAAAAFFYRLALMLCWQQLRVSTPKPEYTSRQVKSQ
jgi:hypothetical protein